jgi:hypothetical protein
MGGGGEALANIVGNPLTPPEAGKPNPLPLLGGEGT